MNLAGGAGPAYDYVLAVGPSRSGTTFLYRALNAHPGFYAPEIKEAHYYRSAGRQVRALGCLLRLGRDAVRSRRHGLVGPAPRPGRQHSAAGGTRILIIALLRRHRD